MVSGEDALQARWSDALETARRAGFERFWVGYAIDGGDSDQWLYFDRHSTIYAGEGTIMSGHIRFGGSPSGISTGGVRLSPLFGARPPQDLAVLLSFVSGSGRPALDRLHLSSYAIPVHFGGLPVLWLGDADDAESVPLLRGYFDRTVSRNLRDDSLSVIGAHRDSRVVVPMLTQWLQGGEPDDLRASAAEWLGYHPDPAALTALARAARQDRSSRVRAEAAESVGDVDLPAASDTLIALARTLQDHAARMEAVESLGERQEEQALEALRDLVRSDPSVEVQQKAVETLGDRHEEGATQLLKQTAESHPRRDVRLQALETVADAAPPEEAMAFLDQVAQQDASVDIQRAAVEALGDIDDPRARRLLLEIAQQHPRYEVRMAAVETLGESAAPAEAFDALIRIAGTDPHPDVQATAVETLGELEDERVPAALKTLAESAGRREVRFRALETLGDLDNGAGIDAVVEILRATQDREMQRKALEVLGDSDHPRAISVLEELIRRPR